MRICFFTDFYPTIDLTAGIGSYTRNIAQALAVRGHQVHVLLARYGRSYDTTDGPVQVHVRWVHWLPFIGRWLPSLGESICLSYSLLRLHHKHRLDVVEFPNWGGMGVIPALLAGPHVIVRVHSSLLEELSASRRTPTAAEKFQLWAEKTSARLARAVVTHSQSQASLVQSPYHLSRITVIPHGIESPALETTEEKAAVLCVGGFNARKGVDTLFGAIPLVLAARPDVEFWLVGRDRDDHAQERFGRQHPDIQPERVRFLGSVTNEDLSHLYSSCAVYASPSLHESFGLTFVEAMAHAKPVVACAISAMRETISHGETGLLVKPGDCESFAEAILRLLNDPALRERYGAAGRERALSHYSATRMAADYERFLGELASQFPP